MRRCVPGGKAAWGVLRRTSSGIASTSFLPYLNLVSTLLSFVHEHVLLRRSDLAGMLGEHLFGTRQPPWTRHLFGTRPPRSTAPTLPSLPTSTSFPPSSSSSPGAPHLLGRVSPGRRARSGL